MTSLPSYLFLSLQPSSTSVVSRYHSKPSSDRRETAMIVDSCMSNMWTFPSNTKQCQCSMCGVLIRLVGLSQDTCLAGWGSPKSDDSLRIQYKRELQIEKQMDPFTCRWWLVCLSQKKGRLELNRPGLTPVDVLVTQCHLLNVGPKTRRRIIDRGRRNMPKPLTTSPGCSYSKAETWTQLLWAEVARHTTS